MPIRTKALADITWQDISDLAASGAAEDAMLEFKGLLPEKNGKPHPWTEGRDQLTDFTRDALAAEVVALANAYGGRLIIGIAETQDRPRKAAGIALLPRCEKFAEQFEQALRSIVDPPIGGLQVRAIVDPTTEDAGAVVLAIPASDLAPHGIGRPPASYVRRGTSCEPMTMRDLQSVFWDARTRRERVEEIRQRHSADLDALAVAQRDGSLRDRNGQLTDKSHRGLCIRVSAIPQQPLSIEELPATEWRNSLRPSDRQIGPEAHSTLGDGVFSSGLSRTAHGLWAVERGPSHWNIRSDGTLWVIGFGRGYQGRDGQDLNFHHPGWYTSLIVQIMAMADKVRRYAGRPDIPIEVDCEIVHEGSAIGGGKRALDWGGDDIGICLPRNRIGPLLLGERANMFHVFQRLEKEVWYAFGAEDHEPLKVDFARLLA